MVIHNNQQISFSYYCVINNNPQNFMELWLQLCCATLCYVESRKYFLPYLQDGRTILRKSRGPVKTNAHRALY